MPVRDRLSQTQPASTRRDAPTATAVTPKLAQTRKPAAPPKPSMTARTHQAVACQAVANPGHRDRLAPTSRAKPDLTKTGLPDPAPSQRTLPRLSGPWPAEPAPTGTASTRLARPRQASALQTQTAEPCRTKPRRGTPDQDSPQQDRQAGTRLDAPSPGLPNLTHPRPP